MKIKTTYSSLVSVLNLMGNVVASNKSLQDDYKVVNIFAKNGKLYALGTDTQLFCMEELEGEFDLENEANPFMVFRIKEISNILSKYSNLQRTFVKEILLETQQKGVVLTVIEEPKESNNFNFSDLYKNQITRYKIPRSNVLNLITKELSSIVMPDNYTEIQSKDLSKYLDYMYTPMTKPKDRAVMHFNSEYVYSVMGNVFGISMPNTLPKNIFSELSLPLGHINFFRTLIPMNETFKIYKEIEIVKRNAQDDSEDDYNIQKSFVLYVQSGSILVKYKGRDTSNTVSTDSFKVSLQNSVEVDKPYLIDTLKRLDGAEQVFLEVNIKEDENIAGKSTAEFIVKTQINRQRIPVKSATGSGEFKFMLRPESLGLMTFSHLTKDIDGKSDKINDLVFYLDWVDSGSVSLTCRDRSEDWQTRWPRAPFKEAPLLDF